MRILLGLSLITLLISCQTEIKNTEDQNVPEEMNAKTTEDPHSYSRPQKVRVSHLDWEADIKFSDKTIHGVAVLTIHRSPESDHLILDSKDLEIIKVIDHTSKEPLRFSLGPDDRWKGSSLTIELEENTEKVSITYITSPDAKALQWLDPTMTAGKNSPFLFTQSQAILARSWIPIQDSPGVRFTFNATIRVPEGLMAVMSAANPTRKNPDGEYSFIMAQPIPAYLFSLSVGDFEFAAVGERTGIYAESELIEKAAYEFAEMEDMVKAAEELYGPYEWERYDVMVLPPSFPFGGMENPRITFATPTILAGDRSLIALIAHELAHSWSGNLVTNATWNDFWLNEGFTVYFEHRIMEKLYGKDYSEMLASLALQDLKKEIEDMKTNGKSEDTALKLDLNGRDPDEGVTSIAYDKGYFFLRALEEKVGRPLFDEFLKTYFKKNAFKVMTTEAFLIYLEENLIKPNNITLSENFISSWVYGEGLPEEHPEPQSQKFEIVQNQANLIIEGEKAEVVINKSDLEKGTWTTHEWMHFLRALNGNISSQQMQELDEHIGFTNQGNSEIISIWFELAINAGYTQAFEAMESFLINTGRRKFLVPLYTALVSNEETKDLALEIYRKARPQYHYVSRNSIDELLKWEQ